MEVSWIILNQSPSKPNGNDLIYNYGMKEVFKYKNTLLASYNLTYTVTGEPPNFMVLDLNDQFTS